MTLEEARNYLENANGKQIKLGLENMTALLEHLEWPNQKLKIIHVAGTNGKGSVCEMLSQILECAGYKVGCFNSPYFEEVNECIRINHTKISNEHLVSYMNQIQPILKSLEEKEIAPSGFEILTALALFYFNQQEVDFVILEVGLGGRLDATNVIAQSELSIITKIALDHENFLGNSLEAIAYEKAGIIKQDGVVVTPIQGEKTVNTIWQVCKSKKAILNMMLPEEIKEINVTDEKTTFTYKGKAYTLGLIGKYQAYNASLVIEAIKTLEKNRGIKIHDKAIKEGLERAKWPGRFEKVQKNPIIFLDGAHNVDGILGLVETLKVLPKKKIIGIMGVLADKDVDKMLELIAPLVDTFIITKPLNPRAMEVEVLAQKVSQYTAQIYKREKISEALELSLELANDQEEIQIVGFGSLYMIGALRKLIVH